MPPRVLPCTQAPSKSESVEHPKSPNSVYNNKRVKEFWCQLCYLSCPFKLHGKKDPVKSIIRACIHQPSITWASNINLSKWCCLSIMMWVDDWVTEANSYNIYTWSFMTWEYSQYLWSCHNLKCKHIAACFQRIKLHCLWDINALKINDHFAGITSEPTTTENSIKIIGCNQNIWCLRLL